MRVPLFPFVLSLVLISACNNKDDCTDIGIDRIEPAANPPGYEVRIVGEGFTTDATVRFDNTEATTTFISATELIAEVPAGLLGSTEVTVEGNSCTARNDDFEVFGAFPPGIPASPVNIVIPQPGNFPSSINNLYANVSDPNHSFVLDEVDVNGVLGEFSTEFHFGNNSFLNDNPITGRVLPNDIELVVDRTAKTDGTIETYSGQFILPSSVGLTAQYVLLLTSQRDGRQLLLARQ